MTRDRLNGGGGSVNGGALSRLNIGGSIGGVRLGRLNTGKPSIGLGVSALGMADTVCPSNLTSVYHVTDLQSNRK